MIHHGDCIEVMAGMDPESVDAIVCDPPYGLEFMGKEWDRLGAGTEAVTDTQNRDGNWTSKPFGGGGQRVRYGRSAVSAQAWHQQWAEAAYRVAKPSAYLLAFGGTRTVHRMTVALEDGGWIIRDMLVWAYASGFPKSKASLKPAWEPIVMARKPGPLRMLNIDECRIGTGGDKEAVRFETAVRGTYDAAGRSGPLAKVPLDTTLGRWPANVVLTDPIFDGGVEGVVGGGETTSGVGIVGHGSGRPSDPSAYATTGIIASSYGDSGTYSRFFIIPKADRADREPVLGGPTSGARAYGSGKGVKTRECRTCGDRTQSDTRPFQPACMHSDWEWKDALPLARANVHPTVKPTDLMRHLVRLVTPATVSVLYCPNCEPNVRPVRASVPTEAGAAVLLSSMSGGVAEAPGDVSAVRGDVPPEGQLAREGSTVLLEGVRDPSGHAAAAGVPGVRPGVPAGDASDPVLFESLREPGDRQDASDHEGLRAIAEGVHPPLSSGSPDGDEDGLSSRASVGDGGAARAEPAADRSGRPYQRGEGRQPTGEPARADEAGARPPAEAEAEAARVSELPPHPGDLGTCGTCGGGLAAGERRGHVLDPFGGSGTTALAAELEGFDWTLIEREAEYVAIAEARLNGTQRGLGLDVGAPIPKMPNTHPDLSKHQPKQRAPGENYSGRWAGTPEEEAS